MLLVPLLPLYNTNWLLPLPLLAPLRLISVVFCDDVCNDAAMACFRSSSWSASCLLRSIAALRSSCDTGTTSFLLRSIASARSSETDVRSIGLKLAIVGDELGGLKSGGYVLVASSTDDCNLEGDELLAMFGELESICGIEMELIASDKVFWMLSIVVFDGDDDSFFVGIVIGCDVAWLSLTEVLAGVW